MLMWISEVIILTDMMFISVNICEYIWQIPVNIMDQCLFKYLGQILTGVFTGVNICFWNSQIFTWAYLWISSKKYEQILTCRTADVIYVAAVKDRGNVDHLLFYNKELAYLNHPSNKRWRGFLYTALDAWYSEFKPSKKRKGRSSGGGPAPAVVDGERGFFVNIDDFVDPLADNDEALLKGGASGGATGGRGWKLKHNL